MAKPEARPGASHHSAAGWQTEPRDRNESRDAAWRYAGALSGVGLPMAAFLAGRPNRGHLALDRAGRALVR
jgi:hypothetical protein